MSVARRTLALVATLAGAAAVALAAVPPPGWTAADPPAAPGALAPRLAPLADGVLATWLEPLRGGAHRLRVARFDGTRWGSPATITTGSALVANWADTPGAAAAGDGSLVAWWLEQIGPDRYAYGIRLARSTDGGASWLPLGWLHDDRVPAEHGFVALVAEGAGARAFWLDGRETPAGRPMTLRSAPVGATVGPAVVVDDAVCDCCPTAAVAVADGALVAYRDRSRDEVRDIRVARVAGATVTTKAAPPDGWQIAGCPVNGPALDTARGRVALAWYAAPKDEARVQVAFSDDDGRSFGTPVTVTEKSPRPALGRVAIALVAGGDGIVAWLGEPLADGTVELRLRRVSSSGRAGAAFSVAPTGAGRSSGIPRLVRLPDGRLLLAWLDSREAPGKLQAAIVDPAAVPAP